MRQTPEKLILTKAGKHLVNCVDCRALCEFIIKVIKERKVIRNRSTQNLAAGKFLML